MTEKLKAHIDKSTLDIVRSLENASAAYLKIGIDLYIENKKNSWKSFQPTVGNLSIACELLLKVFVARNMFSNLYPNLKKESQAILNYPTVMPSSTTINRFIGDLTSFSEKVIDFNQAISLFYLLYPQKKQELQPHFHFLSSVRNISVHAALPEFQRYHLERIAYISSKLFLHARDEKINRVTISIDKRLEKIIQEYDDYRVKKVHDAIQAAKNKAKSLETLWKVNDWYDDDWGSLDETCPVCTNNALSYGSTEEDEASGRYTLLFFKESFECEHCGLVLEDEEELQLAGIQTCEDISSYYDDWVESKNSEDYL